MGDRERVRFERLGDERAVRADDTLRPTHAVEFRMLPRLRGVVQTGNNRYPGRTASSSLH